MEEDPDISSNIANAKNTPADRLRLNALIKASLIAISADVFLIILKTVLAKLTNSAVLTADAWHSTGDFALSLSVLLSIIVNYNLKAKTWAKNAEGFVALLISFILMVGGVMVLYEVIRNQQTRFKLSPNIPLIVAIAGISIACAVSFRMFRFKRRVGKEQKSIAFSAESDHTFSDFFTSIGVLVTLLLGYFGIHIERLTTFIIGIVVIRIGITLHLRSLRFFNISFHPSFDFTEYLPEKYQSQSRKYISYMKSFYKKYRDFETRFSSKYENWVLKKWNGIIIFQLILIILLYLGTGFYSVLPYRTGLELAFGKVSELTPPGLHYHLPKPFGDLILVDTGVVARVESGYRTLWNYKGKEPEAYLWEFTHRGGKYAKVPNEAITMTGDENLVDVNFLCYYKIVDPVEYALNCDNSHELLRNLFVYEIHSILGGYRLDSLLTTSRGKVQNELYERMRKIAKKMPIGVEILKVYMEEAHPPLEVVPSYRSVASAREHKNQIIHQAHAYYNDLIPRSRGKSKAIIYGAEAYASEKTLTAKGEAENFLLKQKNYSKFKQTQKDRLWWDTVTKTLSKKNIYILPAKAKKRFFPSENKIGVTEQ